MIITAIISSIIALFCYFVIWKPILTRCPTLSVLIPPICLATQSFLQMYAEKYIQTYSFQYFIVASKCTPSSHVSFFLKFLTATFSQKLPKTSSTGASLSLVSNMEPRFTICIVTHFSFIVPTKSSKNLRHMRGKKKHFRYG